MNLSHLKKTFLVGTSFCLILALSFYFELIPRNFSQLLSASTFTGTYVTVGTSYTETLNADFTGDQNTVTTTEDQFTGYTVQLDSLQLDSAGEGFTNLPATGIPWGFNASEINMADYDGDLDQDLMITGLFGQSEFYRNDGGRVFVDSGITVPDGMHGGVVSGDFTGNGEIDFGLHTFGAGGFADIDFDLYENDGTPNFTAHSVLDLASVAIHNPGKVSTAVDLNGDTFLDVFLPRYQTTDQSLLINDGAGNFTETVIVTPGVSYDAEIVNLDGDADFDVVMAQSNADEVILFNDGAGNFTQSTFSGALGSTEGIGVGDLDNDGDLDIVAASYDSDDTIHWNDGAFNFSADVQVLPGGNAQGSDVHIVDFDQNGFNDVLIVNDRGVADQIYFNQGARVFTQVNLADTGNQAAVVDDFDADGYIDIAYSENTGAAPQIWWGGFSYSLVSGDYVQGVEVLDGQDRQIVLDYEAPAGTTLEIEIFDEPGTTVLEARQTITSNTIALPNIDFNLNPRVQIVFYFTTIDPKATARINSWTLQTIPPAATVNADPIQNDNGKVYFTGKTLGTFNAPTRVNSGTSTADENDENWVGHTKLKSGHKEFVLAYTPELQAVFDSYNEGKPGVIETYVNKNGQEAFKGYITGIIAKDRFTRMNPEVRYRASARKKSRIERLSRNFYGSAGSQEKLSEKYQQVQNLRPLKKSADTDSQRTFKEVEIIKAQLSDGEGKNISAENEIAGAPEGKKFYAVATKKAVSRFTKPSQGERLIARGGHRGYSASRTHLIARDKREYIEAERLKWARPTREVSPSIIQGKNRMENTAFIVAGQKVPVLNVLAR